jgi:hypothetical protein
MTRRPRNIGIATLQEIWKNAMPNRKSMNNHMVSFRFLSLPRHHDNHNPTRTQEFNLNFAGAQALSRKLKKRDVKPKINGKTSLVSVEFWPPQNTTKVQL